MTLLLRNSLILAVFAAAFVVSTLPGGAQVANGTIAGQVTDTTGAVPGVVVEAVHAATNGLHSATTDAEGHYRLAGLPVGAYRVKTSLAGFKTVEADVQVAVGTNPRLDMHLEPGRVTEIVDVLATAPRDSGVERVVDLLRLQELPVNGRQLADLVATLPGVGLGAHSDPVKNSQHTPQVSGGNGRGVGVYVDGGDNNDSTVGGQLQQIPLEAIEEFNLQSQRFDAEFGQAGAVMNIVTKSGTNALRGSWFNSYRHDALNARTFTEERSGAGKQPYERNQFGGSIGGPLVLDQAHFFVAYERTRQDTRQVVNTGGLLDDGIYDVPFGENLFTGKVTARLNPSHYLSVRYAHDDNSQVSGAAVNTAFTTWATSTNSYDSVNVNHNWMFRRGALNEIVFQYSHYLNDMPSTGEGPAITLASGARAGANANAPQSTEQTRFQFRNDYSWGMSSHQFRTGVNIVRTPTLSAMNQAGTSGIYTMASDDIDGGVARIMLIGGSVTSNLPHTTYGVFLQDDWRLGSRLTLNLGVRWDYSDLLLAQTSQNFVNMQAAGQTGRFDGTLLRDFGMSPRGDFDNIQPRLGAVYDLRGDGRTLARGGWGIYSDLSFTNQNLLTASLEGSGLVLSAVCLPTQLSAVCGPQGFLKTDGTLFTRADPISSIGLPLMTPTTGEVVSPRLEMPYSYQTNIGLWHQLDKSTSLSMDYVRVDGHDLNMRVRPNVDVNADPMVVQPYLAGVGVTPNNSTFRTAVSQGRSRYDAFVVAGRRRMTANLDLDASYTLSRALSDVGTAYDELTQNLLQDINDPFSDFQLGPSTRTDSRHRITASAIVQLPYEIRTAAIVWYRSALPVTTLEGVDLNGDGVNNDHTPMAYRYAGLNADGSGRVEEAGACVTVNCSRRAPFSQVDLRVSRSFRLFGTARIELMAELFNLFNARNPSIPVATTRLDSNGPIPAFMQPSAFAGDVGQPEQRVGQVGFRFTF